MKDLREEKIGVLGWMAGNHVAANLLMFVILVGGIIATLTNRMEIFPKIDTHMISVTVPYRGASPQDSEEGVCIRVEEAVSGIEDVKKIYSTASEGSGNVTVEVEDFADTQEVLDDVKEAVDRIETFPKETEKPIVAILENPEQVVTIVLYGEASQKSLKKMAERIRDDLRETKGISQVGISGVPLYEMSIEISEETLRKYDLSFDKIAKIIRGSSLDLPGGSVKTKGGEILIRTKGQKYVGKEFENITVLTKDDGSILKLGDIGTVVDGFEETPVKTRFNRHPAVFVNIYRVGQQDTLDVVGKVKKYIEDHNASLPNGIHMALWGDNSSILKSRLRLLIKNAMFGLILVFLCLALFLDLKLAFWTTMGIPISFLGALWLLPLFSVTVNMISLYAFIICLGIVVDDAIVVGENIYEYRRSGKYNSYQAAVKGVTEMAAPVTFAVLTTIVAFAPLLFTKGRVGEFLRVIPIVVISVLVISLLEALFILPAHLSSSLDKTTNGPIARGQKFLRDALDKFVYGAFAKLVMFAVKWRYVTLALAISAFMLMVGARLGGYINFTFLNQVDSNNVFAILEMPQGTPIEVTTRIAKRIEAAALETRDQIDAKGLSNGKSIVKSVATTVGQSALVGTGPEATKQGPARSHIASVNVELLGGEQRSISSSEFANKWRSLVGEIAGVTSLTFKYSLFSAGDKVKVELSDRDPDQLNKAVALLKKHLSQYEGVKDIHDSFVEGKREIKLSLRPRGRSLGLTLSDLARQVRQGFYGEEIQRIQRGKDDVRVMLRYPVQERKSLWDVENMRIRTPDGREVAFDTVAKVKYGRGYSSIKRADKRRVINVLADVDETVAKSEEINKEIFSEFLPKLQESMPSLRFGLEGEQRSKRESMGSLGYGFIYALFGIFVLLAIQFRSYAQPLIIMSAIPFGLIGAVIGHLMFGKDLSLLSVFGIVALMGIVVNDSLIMVDLINRERSSGVGLQDVLRDSATRRFRPIILTTLTTSLGLVPMILEKSVQAQFLIPMAISLGFGILFATSITLLLVPSLYMILEDFHNFFGSKSPHHK